MCVNNVLGFRGLVLRRAGAIAAILACVVYTMLATWHGVLMRPANAQASTPEATLGLALTTAICHGGVGQQTATPDGAPGPSPSPGQSSDCPVCKGLAACHLAILVAAELGLLVPPDNDASFSWANLAGSDRSSILPRSRGPPLPV